MSRVVVCGSLNMDVVVQSARLPEAGETLLGAEVSFLPGGKGLNQAIASARLGSPTAMVGAVGNDSFANSLRGFLADNDVDRAVGSCTYTQLCNESGGIEADVTLMRLAPDRYYGVTGSGFIVLAATLSAVGGVPVAGLALILGIDRFMSEARALTNLVGNGVATLVVAKWCGELDTARMQARLNGETAEEAEAPEAVLDATEARLAA